MAIKEMDYAPSGSIFTNDRKRGVNDPDYNGYLKITSDTLDYLIKKRKEQVMQWEEQNPDIDWNTVDKTKMFDLELEMVAWGKKTKRDTNWLRLIASIPRKPQSKNPF